MAQWIGILSCLPVLARHFGRPGRPEAGPRDRRGHLQLAILAAILLTATGCTPQEHRIDPPYAYEGGLYSASQIEAIAAEACSTNAGGALPPNSFSTDGCSMWPDGDFRECCIKHDMRYWCGGPAAQRKPADRALRACVADRSNAFHAFVVYTGTRLGGGRLMPFPWRWGYGYPYPYAYPRPDHPDANEP